MEEKGRGKEERRKDKGKWAGDFAPKQGKGKVKGEGGVSRRVHIVPDGAVSFERGGGGGSWPKRGQRVMGKSKGGKGSRGKGGQGGQGGQGGKGDKWVKGARARGQGSKGARETKGGWEGVEACCFSACE